MQSEMLRKPAPRVLVPVVCLGLLTPLASALTLGRVEGAAVLGRPLDLRVAVTLDTGMALDDLCPQVDLLYGDNRVDPRRVEVQAAGGGDQAVLRAMDEVPRERFVEGGFTDIAYADQALPIEAAMTSTIASHCRALSASARMIQPATAPTAGSRLSRMLKLRLGKCLRAYISSA